MENGVEKLSISQDEITRTADGGISHLNLADKVVEVFVNEEEVVGVEGEDKNDVEESNEPLPSEEIETQDEITRTADGGVSRLNLADKVVEVFHDETAVAGEGEDKEDVEERTEPLLSEEIESKTADDAVKKDSDGDDVFEEAITDDNPPLQPAAEESNLDHFKPPVSNGEAAPSEDFHSLAEVNGKASAGELHQGDKFEEVVDSNPSNDDPSAHTVDALDKFKVADGDQLPTELSNAVVSNEQEDKEEVSSTVTDVDGDVKVELNGEPDVTAYAESGEDGVVKVVDNDDNGKELHLEESPDGLVCNRDEDENKASGLIANGESTDAQLEPNGSYVSDNMDSIRSELEDMPVVPPKSLDVGGDIAAEPIVYEDGQSVNGVFDDSLHCDTENRKTENGGSERSELEDKPVVPTQSLDGGDVAAEPIVYEDGQSVNGVFDDSLRFDTENRKTENGGSEMIRLDEKPVLEKPFPVDRVGSDDIDMSDGCDDTEKVHSEQDESYSMRHTVASADSFVIEEIQTAERRSTPNNLGVSVDQVTDAERELSDTMESATEFGENVSPNLEARHQYENTQEVPAVRAVVKEAESQKMPNEGKKQDLTSIEASNDSGSARAPEIPPAVEPVQAPRHRPAGLGGAAPLFEPTSRALQQPRVNGAAPQRQAELVEDPASGEADGNDETREKLQMIRVKFLRLAHRLGQTPHNVVVAQVLYRLGLAEQLRGRNAGRAGAFSFDRASAMAEQLESAGQGPLDFSCTIMVLGKTGVGKSATINSIFDENKFSTDAFQLGTKKVQDVVGTVQGIKVRVIDTPGLLPCWSDQRYNEKILQSVKRFIKKTPPDIVLYLDRLDMQNRDFGDLPLLRTITEIFGPSIWFNAIVVLTHAASAPPDGPNGVSSSYEMFVTQRSHVVQQAIRQAAGDMRLMNPVSLVENHSACRTNRAGQRVLPNGQVWKPHLLLLSFASKILAEANTLLKLQDNPPGKPFAPRPRVPPLPYLLSSLLQSRPQLKLPEEQFGDEDDLDEDLDESSDSDYESEYDELPPFKRLTGAQLSKLSKAQKKAYFDELEYREKLFMKKQLKEEKRRRRMLKKMAGMAKEAPNEYAENAEEEAAGGASVPVAMPDFSLPASFDSDNPSHRYRFLDTSNPWLVRPVLETHGWDHDVGYEGINVERLFVVKDKIPVSISGQATKDKKESNLQMELASSIKHSEGRATSLGFDMQPIGKDMSYTLRSETRFSNFRNNKTAAGLCVTLLGDALTAGVKLEDKLTVNKRLRLVLTGGAMSGRGDVAYGGSLEASLRDKDYPLGRMLSTLGLSIMDWHGDLAIGCNVQTQTPIGRSSNLIARANLNNRGSGQVSIRLNSSEQLQIALVGLLPLLRKAVSLYQQSMYGE